METEYKNMHIGGQMNATAKRKVILDNEYLPFVPIKGTLLELEVGDIAVWPARKMNSIRIMASRIKAELGREFKCAKNRKDNTAVICRIA